LAFARIYCIGIIWNFDCFKPRFCGCSFYLYNFL